MANTKETPATPVVDISKFTPFGDNILAFTTDTHAFFAVPIDPATLKNARPSASGKTRTVGSTSGLMRIPGKPLRVNLTMSADVPVPAV